MRSKVIGSVCVMTLVIAFAGPAEGARHDKEITYDHLHQLLTPTGPVSLARGDQLTILVTNTRDDCFAYPVSVTKAQGLLPGEAATLTTVPIKITHDGKAAGYTLSIKLLSGLSEQDKGKCTQQLKEAEVAIPVETLAWSLGFAGAFTVDGNTDNVYYLVPGSANVNGTQKDGFYVRQNHDGQDLVTLGTAAMIHLFHTDPDRFRLLGGNWVPISFGLGVGAESKAKYFFGTSLRFDEHLYLTTGIALGAVKRLPNALDTTDHSFTTDATALDNLPTRNEASWFLGISYTFLGRNMRQNDGPFAAAFAPPASK